MKRDEQLDAKRKEYEEMEKAGTLPVETTGKMNIRRVLSLTAVACSPTRWGGGLEFSVQGNRGIHLASNMSQARSQHQTKEQNLNVKPF